MWHAQEHEMLHTQPLVNLVYGSHLDSHLTRCYTQLAYFTVFASSLTSEEEEECKATLFSTLRPSKVEKIQGLFKDL